MTDFRLIGLHRGLMSLKKAANPVSKSSFVFYSSSLSLAMSLFSLEWHTMEANIA